jgi:SAM-dependent methyltransferase
MAPDANEQQREYWNGDESREWVVESDRFDAMLAPFVDLLLGAASLADDDHVIDIGCGNGATTLAAARRVGDGDATGFDISAPMVGVAQRRAASLDVSNARFTLGDAQVDALGGPYDVAMSRFGIMFFADPVAAFTNIRSALAPGARAAFLCWRPMIDNEWMFVPTAAALALVPPPDLPGPDAPGPFRFGEAGSLASTLEDAGFVDVSSESIDTAMLLGGPGTFDEACAFLEGNGITRRVLGDAPADLRQRAIAAMRDALAPFQTDEGVRMNGAVWLVRARA